MYGDSAHQPHGPCSSRVVPCMITGVQPRLVALLVVVVIGGTFRLQGWCRCYAALLLSRLVAQGTSLQALLTVGTLVSALMAAVTLCFRFFSNT